MCGISGALSLKAENICEKIIIRMNDTINHRGPDNSGIYVSNKICIGHKRLSIIDLTDSAKQPMFSDDQRFIISYNGEIYNFLELKNILIKKGHQFNTKSDTEVVLKSFIEWGIESFNKFNGMFALAIWDKELELLYLSRDRYGIKPIYYYFCDGLFLFASEIKSIVAHPNFKKELNYPGVAEYFTFQNFFSCNNFYKNVHILEAGNYKIVNINESSIKTIKYWDFSFKENHNLTKNDCLEELDKRIKNSIKRTLISDVEVGSYLSGGIDSGSITSLISRKYSYLKTFTCGFDLNSASGIELCFDERDLAEFMSYKFKTEHYEVVLKAGDLERIMEKIVTHVEEPRVGQCYPNFYISKLASKFVKVVMSGTGGDELFAGYPWRYYQGLSSKNFDEFVYNYHQFWVRLMPLESYNKVFDPISNEIGEFNSIDIFKNVFAGVDTDAKSPNDFINLALYFEAKTFLHGLLVIEDKISMANSLETRIPFLDNDLVDFSSQIPIALKLKNFEDNVNFNKNPDLTNSSFKKTNDGKYILRELMKSYLPNEVLKKEKKGFSAPDSSWFKGESLNYVTSKIMQKNSNIFNFLDRDIIFNLLNEHFEGKNNNRLLIWSLLYFEKWLELNF
tara:strand:+ start:12323 stop:14185 length:1863 start_codon:yes stop_codon:yes gene_type:complete